MNYWYRILIMSVAALLCVTGILPTESNAADIELDSNSDGRRSLFFSDTILRGTAAQYDSFIEIGKGLYASEGSYIELSYSVSPSLLPEWSTLSVRVDDQPVDVIALEPAGEVNKIWRIDLSALRLEAGFHKISFVARMRTTEMPVCEDPLSDKLWMTAHSTSQAFLSLVPAYQDADLSWYPSPFIERGSRNPLHAVMVVPDEPTEAEFTAAVQLSQFIVSQSPDARSAIPIYIESEITGDKLQSSHMIWIGKSDRWLDEGVAVAESALRAADRETVEHGAIFLLHSPWNPEKKLLLLTGTGEKLTRGAKILTDFSLINQLRGKVLPVGEQPVGLETAFDGGGQDSIIVTTLNQLGLTNLSIQNSLQGTIQFQYPLPVDRVIGEPAQLKLMFTHSEAVLFGKSVMTVGVNGIPVKSVRLTRRTANSGLLEAEIDPSAVGNSRKLNIEIAFQFANPAVEQAMDREFQCEDTLLGDWAVIDGNSMLSIPLAERITVDLQSLPFPFVSEEAWENTLLLAPQWGSRELQLAMTIAGYLGAANPSVPSIKPMLTSSVGWKSEAGKAHIIYIGTTETLPDELNGFEGSYVQFDGSRIAALSEEVDLLQPGVDGMAFVQLTPSPFDSGKALFIAAGTSRERLTDLAVALADSEQSFSLTGRFVSLDADGVLHKNSDTEVPSPPPVLASSAIGRWSRLSIGGPQFLVIVFVVIAILSLAYWLTRKTN